MESMLNMLPRPPNDMRMYDSKILYHFSGVHAQPSTCTYLSYSPTDEMHVKFWMYIMGRRNECNCFSGGRGRGELTCWQRLASAACSSRESQPRYMTPGGIRRESFCVD